MAIYLSATEISRYLGAPDDCQPDVAKIRKVLDWAKAESQRSDEQGEWDQEIWYRQHSRCGTAMCIAGRLVEDEPGWDAGSIYDNFGGHGIRDAAAQIAGLSHRAANFFFSGSNSIYGLYAIAAHLTQGEIQIPPDVHPEG